MTRYLLIIYGLVVEIDQRRLSSKSIPLYSFNTIVFDCDIHDLTNHVFDNDSINVNNGHIRLSKMMKIKL